MPKAAFFAKKDCKVRENSAILEGFIKNASVFQPKL